MKIKIRLDDADANKTEGHQIKSTRSAFDFQRIGVEQVDSDDVSKLNQKTLTSRYSL